MFGFDTTTFAIFGFGGLELAVVGGIALLLFGNRLPGAAKSLGQSFTAFKTGLKDGSEEDIDGQEPQKLDQKEAT